MSARTGRWIRFLIGLAALGACIAFFASGYSPPGALGEVLRHNQEHDIDASPLFYSEVENMHELEAGLAELMGRAGAISSSAAEQDGQHPVK